MLAFAVNPVIGNVGVALLLIAAVAGIVAYFLQQRAKGIIGLQSVEIDTQKKRIDTLEEENARKGAEIIELRTSLRVLTETVTQSAKVEMLASASESQHRAIIVSLDQLCTTTKQLADQVAALGKP